MTTGGDDWLFDLGNTRLKRAPRRADGTPGDVHAEAHCPGHDASLPSGRCAWVSSVASPVRTIALLEALSSRFERICIARTPAALGGVRIGYRHPGRLGVDRALAMLAAHARGPGPWLVAGVGTALTLDLLDRDGTHLGGRIAPSPTVMREALHARASQLPPRGGAYVEFALDTEDALASGCDGAARALVERSLLEGAGRCGADVTLLLHGGGAAALAPLLRGAQVAPALVIEGLAAWARAVTARA